jgi:hypothetical protein
MIKGTVTRDFLLLAFFMNQFPPQPQSISLGPFRVFTCEYLREFSKKIRNDPNDILRGLGETDS